MGHLLIHHSCVELGAAASLVQYRDLETASKTSLAARLTVVV